MNDGGTTQALVAAQALGLQLPSPAYLLGMIFFGLVGLVAFRSGRRRGRPVSLGLGLALMLYPYLVSGTAWLYLVGAALCAGLWFDRA